MSSPSELIFALGTNNWQFDDEPAPGSGILHESHHNTFNNPEHVPGKVKMYSIFPSAKHDVKETLYRTIKLSHDIPICESSGPVSSYRWHSMSDEQFNAYHELIRSQTEQFIEEAEKKEGRPFTLFIAHHCFMNPVILGEINKKRAASGKTVVPLLVFAHGTALKMFQNENRGEKEYPLRFGPMMKKLRIFEDAETVQGVFAIANAQKDTFREVFPCFPADRVVVSPNGYNQQFFTPLPKGKYVPLDDVISSFKPVKYSGFEADGVTLPDSIPQAKFSHLVMCTGRLADWKRHDAVIRATQLASAPGVGLPKFATLIAGGGPNAELRKLQLLAYKELNLDNLFFIGPQSQEALSRLNQVASVGCYPSKDEPFGLVIIECMACSTPVICANSGGPKDFVGPDVGVLIPESDDINVLAQRVSDNIKLAITDDWKAKMGPAGAKFAANNYSLASQCNGMLQYYKDSMQKNTAASSSKQDPSSPSSSPVVPPGSPTQRGWCSCRTISQCLIGATLVAAIAYGVMKKRGQGKL